MRGRGREFELGRCPSPALARLRLRQSPALRAGRLLRKKTRMPWAFAMHPLPASGERERVPQPPRPILRRQLLLERASHRLRPWFNAKYSPRRARGLCARHDAVHDHVGLLAARVFQRLVEAGPDVIGQPTLDLLRHGGAQYGNGARRSRTRALLGLMLRSPPKAGVSKHVAAPATPCGWRWRCSGCWRAFPMQRVVGQRGVALLEKK